MTKTLTRLSIRLGIFNVDGIGKKRKSLAFTARRQMSAISQHIIALFSCCCCCCCRQCVVGMVTPSCELTQWLDDSSLADWQRAPASACLPCLSTVSHQPSMTHPDQCNTYHHTHSWVRGLVRSASTRSNASTCVCCCSGDRKCPIDWLIDWFNRDLNLFYGWLSSAFSMQVKRHFKILKLMLIFTIV